MTVTPIAERLFVEGPDPHLIGGRELETGRIVFPCPPNGIAARYDAVALPREGTLWSWTIQRFRPKSPPYAGPEEFQPYAVGYIDLDEVIVEARLVDIAFDAIRIGDRYRTAMVSFEIGATGESRTMYAFAPVQGSSS